MKARLINEGEGKLKFVEGVALFKTMDWTPTNHSGYEFSDYREDSNNSEVSLGVWRGYHNDMYTFTAEDWNGELFYAWFSDVDDTPQGQGIKVFQMM